jgi:hypothetical protein
MHGDFGPPAQHVVRLRRDALRAEEHQAMRIRELRSVTEERVLVREIVEPHELRFEVDELHDSPSAAIVFGPTTPSATSPRSD